MLKHYCFNCTEKTDFTWHFLNTCKSCGALQDGASKTQKINMLAEVVETLIDKLREKNILED